MPSPRLALTLKISVEGLERARDELLRHGLIAYDAPLYQVLSLATPPWRAGGR